MPCPDLSDVRLPHDLIPHVALAATTRRPLILVGATGSGRTLLARRLPGLLPQLSDDERAELASIYERTGLDCPDAPPFRAPHHSASLPAMLGGGQGKAPRPGEVSLAHGGVLYLDEAEEIHAHVLTETIRAVRRGHTDLVRATSTTRYPARTWLVLAVPCACARPMIRSLLPDAIEVTLPRQVDLGAEPWPPTAEIREAVELCGWISGSIPAA